MKNLVRYLEKVITIPLPYLSNLNKFTKRIPTSMINNAINQLNTCLGFYEFILIILKTLPL